VGFLPGKKWLVKNRIKNKNHMIVSVEVKKVFDKI
jgi:hypothetical protein